MAQPVSWTQELDLCTESFEHFQTQYPNIKEQISSLEPKYKSFFFSKISFLIIHSKEISPLSKFLAVYLLLQLSEDVGKLFAMELGKENDLLDYLYQVTLHESSKLLAFDERGKFFFSKAPSPLEARIGINFVRLCIESLIFWRESFGEWNPKSPCHSFLLYSSTLKKKFKKMIYYHFIYKKYDLSQNLAAWNFHNALPKVIETIEQEARQVVQPNDEDENEDVEEDWEIEELNKSDSQPQGENEGERFTDLLRKATIRNVLIDLDDQGPSTNERQQAIFEEDIEESLPVPNLVKEPISSGTINDDGIADNEKLNVEDLKDEEIDENKSIISVSYSKETLPGSKLDQSLNHKDYSTPKRLQPKSAANVGFNELEQEISPKSFQVDGKFAAHGKGREDKIVDELSEIQKSIQKSRLKLTNPSGFSTSVKRISSDENPPSDLSIEMFKKPIRSTQKRVTFTAPQSNNKQTQGYSSIWGEKEEIPTKAQHNLSLQSTPKSAKNLPSSRSGLDLDQGVCVKKAEETTQKSAQIQLDTNNLHFPISKKAYDPFSKSHYEKIKPCYFTPKHTERTMNTTPSFNTTPNSVKASDLNNFQAFSFTPSSGISKQSGSNFFSSPVSTGRSRETAKLESFQAKLERAQEERPVFLPFSICKNKQFVEAIEWSRDI